MAAAAADMKKAAAPDGTAAFELFPRRTRRRRAICYPRQMPEQYRRPSWHEANLRIERARRAREAEQEAVLIVRNFNARLSVKRSAGFWPTIATALASKYVWLRILCDSCGVVTDLDLSMKPRDPEAPVRVAMRDVRCIRCNGHGRPRIIGLARGAVG